MPVTFTPKRVFYGTTRSGFSYCLCLLLLQVFCEVAYRAVSVQNIVDGINEFLDELIVLPPSIWDPHARLEPPLTTRSKVLVFPRLLSL